MRVDGEMFSCSPMLVRWDHIKIEDTLSPVTAGRLPDRGVGCLSGGNTLSLIPHIRDRCSDSRLISELVNMHNTNIKLTKQLHKYGSKHLNQSVNENIKLLFAIFQLENSKGLFDAS